MYCREKYSQNIRIIILILTTPESIEAMNFIEFPLQSPPTCRHCYNPRPTRKLTKGNANGNAGRHYYKCFKCNKFLCFDDDLCLVEGVGGKSCCKYGYRIGRAGSDRDYPGFLYRGCAGGCGFFEWVLVPSEAEGKLAMFHVNADAWNCLLATGGGGRRGLGELMQNALTRLVYQEFGIL